MVSAVMTLTSCLSCFLHLSSVPVTPTWTSAAKTSTSGVKKKNLLLFIERAFCSVYYFRIIFNRIAKKKMDKINLQLHVHTVIERYLEPFHGRKVVAFHTSCSHLIVHLR